ncbi:hypothetical protein EVAR_71067_1 [Eumeta japonica]|uniref:Uncharacterized protein n=1 Tax=Eumeta variegata TaxID=151549 RepID=A0A4C1T4I8_EUMVA|nr:hypothetical protein EVAR_71067_1 [Eumeta japonica]
MFTRNTWGECYANGKIYILRQRQESHLRPRDWWAVGVKLGAANFTGLKMISTFPGGRFGLGEVQHLDVLLWEFEARTASIWYWRQIFRGERPNLTRGSNRYYGS